MHSHKNLLLDGSSPFAIRSMTILDDKLENCRDVSMKE